MVTMWQKHSMNKGTMSTTLHGPSNPIPQWRPSFLHRMTGRHVYVSIGILVGMANIVLATKSLNAFRPSTIDFAFTVAALLILAVIPLRPVWGVIAYLVCWLLLLALPDTYSSDMTLTHVAFFFFLGRFLPPGYAGVVFLITVGANIPAIQRDATGAFDYSGLLAFQITMGLIIIPIGSMMRASERSRREEALRERGLHFVGMGVSGGEEGALNGPSIMPGGTAESYKRLGPMLESISAHVDGVPCCTHVGPDGAGHFVKMVHNGIEYADMQLIAEAYDLLRHVGGFTVPEIAEVFRSWKDSELDSYLIDITTEVLSHTDATTGEPFVDVVVDAAGQKGTGAWTTQTALELGVAVPAIAEATFARAVSSETAPQTESVSAETCRIRFFTSLE